MSHKTRPARDRFALSLGGAASVNSHTLVPAVADDLRQDRKPASPRDVAATGFTARGSRTARAIEEFLARYYAPGYREAVQGLPKLAEETP